MGTEVPHQESEGLVAYRQINTAIPIGGISTAQCIELRGVSDDTSSPMIAYDRAWLGIELSIALGKTPDPETGKARALSVIDKPAQASREEFRAIASDEAVPPLLRAQARVASASIGLYRDATTTHRMSIVSKHFIPYLRTLQTTGRDMLTNFGGSADEERFLHSLTILALLSEYTVGDSFILPASPRQPWDINRYNTYNSEGNWIAIGDKALPDGVVGVDPILLEHRAWRLPSQPENRFGTLAVYSGYRAGFASRQRTQKHPDSTQVGLQRIIDRMLDYFNHLPPNSVSIQPNPPAEQLPEPVNRTSTERAWYTAQSSHDIDSLPISQLRLNIASLGESLEQTDNALDPSERYVLAWMHLDYAWLLAKNAQKKKQEAEQERRTASRVSRSDAPAHHQSAARTDAEATALLTDAAVHFDTAETTFTTTADMLQRRRPGDALEALLGKDAAAVYKALLAETDPVARDKAVSKYAQRMAALDPKLREAAASAKKDKAQLESLQAVALHISTCLLVTASTDEIARHMVLPAPLRAGSTRGKIDAVVFPLDASDNSYETEHPVYVSLKPNSQITTDGRFIEIGSHLLMHKGNPFDFLKNLARVTRATKHQQKARRSRGPAVDDLTLRISDAIEDAR